MVIGAAVGWPVILNMLTARHTAKTGHQHTFLKLEEHYTSKYRKGKQHQNASPKQTSFTCSFHELQTPATRARWPSSPEAERMKLSICSVCSLFACRYVWVRLGSLRAHWAKTWLCGCAFPNFREQCSSILWIQHFWFLRGLASTSTASVLDGPRNHDE